MIASLLGPAAARASDRTGNYPGGENYKGGFSFALRGQASSGFEFLISGYEQRWGSRFQRASLELYRRTKGHQGVNAVYYQDHKLTRVNMRRVEFDLGPLGSVKLRFRPHSRRVTKRDGCRGTYTKRRGTFRGRIDFRAENDYARVPRRVKLRGSLDVERLYNCFGARAQKAGADPPTVRLTACDERSTLNLAEGGARGHLYFMYPPVEKVAPGILVTRAALVRGGTFDYGQDMRSASLVGPFPFRGEARYVGETKASGHLEGSLRVRLPGVSAPFGIDGAPTAMRRTRDIVDCPAEPPPDETDPFVDLLPGLVGERTAAAPPSR